MKKVILVFIGVLFFSRCSVVFASPVINELMYDLDGADIDWVEIYNGDNTDVDLTTLKLLISNSTSNHSIVKSSGSQVLHPGEYGIIIPTPSLSAFTAKWGSAGNLFTSSFSLPNDAAKVEINNGDKNLPLSSVSYTSAQGATEDGKSLQLINGAWTAALPTPGATNQTLPPPAPPAPTPTPTPSSPDTGGIVSSSKKEEPKFKLKIISPTLAFAATPLEFQGMAFSSTGEPLRSGKYFWNFGDGYSKEINNTEKFTHIYFYPGVYTLSLEYYSNYYSPIPDVINKIAINIIPITVSISKVGDTQDFFIELSNNSDYEIDTSNWSLSSLDKNFIFPKNSSILAKSKITLSPQITNFNFDSAKNLKLITSMGQIAFDYGSSLVPVKIIAQKPSSVPIKISMAPKKDINLAKEETKLEIPMQDLPAASVQSTIAEDQNYPYLFIIALIAFLGVAAGSVYFIRRKKVITKVGNDFEILDE